MQDAKQKDFFQVPEKIFRLGLNGNEIAVFCAIISHDGSNARGIYPSRSRLGELTGLSLRTVNRAIVALGERNVIQWDRGHTGKANTYSILGTGCWTPKPPLKPEPKRGSYATQAQPKRVDKSPKSSDNSVRDMPIGHNPNASQAQPVMPVRPTNHIQLNQIQLTRFRPLDNLIEGIEARRQGTGRDEFD